MSDRTRLLILGATGRLGQTLAKLYATRYELLTPTRKELDLGQPESVRASLEKLVFDVVINTAAVTSPDVCEDDFDLAQKVNAESPEVLAEICAERNVRFIHFSTDYVFSGKGCVFLNESAPAHPINAYGRSKRAGELAVMAKNRTALIGRVSWLFGPSGGGLPDSAISRARENQPLGFIEDKWSVPTSTVDIAEWTERLFTDLGHVSGPLHLCNTGVATWRDYAQVTLDLAHRHGLLSELAHTSGLSLKDFPNFKAARPPFTVMSNAKLSFLLGHNPRRWQDALESYVISTL